MPTKCKPPGPIVAIVLSGYFIWVSFALVASFSALQKVYLADDFFRKIWALIYGGWAQVGLGLVTVLCIWARLKIGTWTGGLCVLVMISWLALRLHVVFTSKTQGLAAVEVVTICVQAVATFLFARMVAQFSNWLAYQRQLKGPPSI